MENLPEWLTRLKKIDVMLKEQGWDVKDKSKVWVEVDSKQSEFKVRKYRVVSETLKNDEESKYIDYMLLDSNGDPVYCNIKKESIEYKITKPAGLVIQVLPINKTRKVCNLCGSNVCINIGNACANNNECGSGYCIENICSPNE